MDWDGITVRIDWTRCTRRRWPPKPRLAFTPQERRKERNVLLYWWAGRGARKLLSGMVPIHAGLCHWSRPGWTYECIQNVRNPLGVTAIHFDLLDARGRVIPPEDARLPPEPLRVLAPRLADEVTRWIAERAMDTRAGVPLPPRIEHVANNLLLALLMKLDYDTPASGGVAGDPGQLAWRRLTTHIQEHLHDLGSMSALAAQAGYTRSHFSRLFKAHAGLSPQQYVINARIALAKELLRGTTLTVSEVAERAGYGDAFQFSRQFRQRTAKTPSAYRAECGDRASPVELDGDRP